MPARMGVEQGVAASAKKTPRINGYINKLLPLVLGIFFMMTGIGISIAANRYKGIRAAILYDDFVAEMAHQHNNANVIVFGGRTMSVDDVIRRIDIFLKTKYEGGRHDRRLAKLDL